MVSEVVIHVCTAFLYDTMYVRSSSNEQGPCIIPGAILAVPHVYFNHQSGKSDQYV